MIRAMLPVMKVCASCNNRALVWSSAPKSKVGAVLEGTGAFSSALTGTPGASAAVASSVVGLDPSGAAGDAAVWFSAAVAASEHCADGVGCSSTGSMGAFLQGLASLRAVSICSGSSYSSNGANSAPLVRNACGVSFLSAALARSNFCVMRWLSFQMLPSQRQNRPR